MYSNVSDTPRMVDEDYKKKYPDPCIADEGNSGFKMIYFGLGITRNKHPLKKRINMRECGNCNNADVKVIYAQWSVHPMSGDTYWDYEVYCEKCKKYSSRSFAGND